MKKIALTVALAGLFSSSTHTVKADTSPALLSEMFGRGIHAYYVGNQDDAREMFTSAIEHGLNDPRVFYFRGILAFDAGKTEEAVKDWKLGAELEANSGINFSVGRSLSRFQGNGRVKLESIRQAAKLEALKLGCNVQNSDTANSLLVQHLLLPQEKGSLPHLFLPISSIFLERTLPREQQASWTMTH